MAEKTKARCPICRQELPPRVDNRAFPFCSPRCKQVDLGNWLGEAYAISTRSDVVIDELDPPSRGQDYEGR